MLLQLPLFSPYPEYEMACIFDKYGQPCDWIGNVDTAINYANQGYIVYVLSDSYAYSRDEIQNAVNAELAARIDCFGDAELYWN